MSLFAATNDENTPQTRGQYVYDGEDVLKKVTTVESVGVATKLIVFGLNMADDTSRAQPVFE